MKLGLQNPSKVSVSLTVVAHRVYHKLKMQYYGMILGAQQSGHFDTVIDTALELGCLFCEDFELR